MADKKNILKENHVGVAESKVADKIVSSFESGGKCFMEFAVPKSLSECGNNGN